MKEKDWEVTCAFPEQFKDVVKNVDISFDGLSMKFLELIEGEKGQLLMGGRGSTIKKVATKNQMVLMSIRTRPFPILRFV